MNKPELAKVALDLRSAMELHGDSIDVQYLLGDQRFRRMVEDAIHERINEPVEPGFGRWMVESDIRSVKEVSANLSKFYLLLIGDDY